MQFVVAFAPWIVYGILDGTAGWRVALIAGLVTCLATISLTVLRRERPDVLSLGGAAFFAVMLAASLLPGVGGAGGVLTGHPLEAWTQAISQGWIAAIMWLSIAFRRPFTLAFSTREAPAEMVGTPEFLRFNDIITAMWALSLTLGTAALVLVGSAAGTALTTVVVAGSITLPVVAMKRYIAHVTAEHTDTEHTDTEAARAARSHTAPVTA